MADNAEGLGFFFSLYNHYQYRVLEKLKFSLPFKQCIKKVKAFQMFYTS